MVDSFSAEQSWVILTPIEARIKSKIEEIGKPLKSWNVRINRGILTGLNEAFIISTDEKNELIKKSPKSAEIIRPILRGRDIKKYKASFAHTWLLNTHNGIKERNFPRINVERDYPAIYKHLAGFRQELETRLDQGDHWTNLRNCAYLDDLEKEKIIWIELTNHPNFYLDSEKYYINNTVFFLVGERLPYLASFLNSKLCEWYFTTIAATSGMGTRRWIKMYVDQIRIPQSIPTPIERRLDELVRTIQVRKKQNESTELLENEIDDIIFSLFNLSDNEKLFVLETLAGTIK